MNKNLTFQIIDWQEYNERTDIELEQIDYKTKKPRIIHPTKYYINLYGKTLNLIFSLNYLKIGIQMILMLLFVF